MPSLEASKGAPIRIGLIGSGFMGRAHAQAFNNAGFLYRLPRQPVLEVIADRDPTQAATAAAALRFERSTGDWREVVTDPAVDLVAIATPNMLHAPIALAAIAAGKPVYCEKPLATSIAEAVAMTAAAQAAALPTGVGFTYLHNPMIALARDIVMAGEIGEIVSFRGIHAEDFMADPDAPFNWRCEAANAGGALADIGSHAIALALYLAGAIESVSAVLTTVHDARPTASGGRRQVEVDDQVDAAVRFASGATGTISASWLAHGWKMGLAFALVGTNGSLSFTQERFNELRLYQSGPSGRTGGFTTILAGPEHDDYGVFCPAAGHQLGYNDLKTIEAKAMIDAISGHSSTIRDFLFALDVEKVADAMRRSAGQNRWTMVSTALDRPPENDGDFRKSFAQYGTLRIANLQAK